MSRYYGSDYSKVKIELTETNAEVRTRNGKYECSFVGELSPLQAIEFVNSVKSVVGKDRIIEVSVNTYLREEE